MEAETTTDKTGNDALLVERMIEGDRKAFEELVSRYSSRVFRLAMHYTRNTEDAEEVKQEVFLTVFRKIEQFQGKSSFSTWLYRVAVNTSLMRLRSGGKAELIPIDDINDRVSLETDEEEPEIDAAIVTEESLARIEKAIEPLPHDFKTVVILRDIEGFSNEETAEIMDLTVPAVKSRLHRARSYLREKLEDLYRETVEN